MRRNARLVVALLVVVLGGCLCAAKAGPPPAKEITLDLGGGVKMELVLIPAGEFVMGDAGGDFDEVPLHKVIIAKPFCLGKYEVTQEQWQAVMGANPARFKGAKSPVERVSWNDCRAFIDKLNQNVGKPGVRFSLPTEAQWEYACRAGTSTRWSFGDDEASTDQYAWWDENSGNTTHPVGQKKPNAWGLYDMHGNVEEWCLDDWPGPNDIGKMVMTRGGSWHDRPTACRSAARAQALAPGGGTERIGFRVVCLPQGRSARFEVEAPGADWNVNVDWRAMS
jgi:formylglycine-generating enzyme required for sulfatase activity